MSRLTDTVYLNQRNQLRGDWFDHRGWTFSRLEPIEEMDLHAYFAPTKDLTDEQAIAHRREASKRDPSLPQRAGRAFARASEYLGKYPELQPSASFVKTQTGPRGEIIVHSVLRPELDVSKLVLALMRLQEDEEKRDAA
jgi:hypothetical protein